MKNKGFTLIELLIVVAIIAILAAIAVPNFLEAQTRAKVSRSVADMRSLAVAIEAYFVDNQSGPTDWGDGPNQRRPYPPFNSPRANFTIGFELSTPVAYISSTRSFVDVFKQGRTDIVGNQEGREFYNFANWQMRLKAGDTTAAAFGILTQRTGTWALWGAGPDRFTNNGGLNGTRNFDFGVTSRIPMGVSYDPTNGTVSHGDIYRTQRFGSGILESNPIDIPQLAQ